MKHNLFYVLIPKALTDYFVHDRDSVYLLFAFKFNCILQAQRVI